MTRDHYNSDDRLVHRVEQGQASRWLACSGDLIYGISPDAKPLTCLWCIARRRRHG